ncbi:uncharacterized protein [Watersipora subatra]|uniref:uncharacterized protein n=1 Tax=Watersipora subatra TaxID=2589382 RepID=UPI00355BD058
MLQLDWLISFAIGSSLATAAGDGLKATQYHTQNKYFIFTLLHINLIVTPLNIYMLWEHTGFETMFYYDASLHGIWPMLTMVASNLSAILGFMTSRKLVRKNKELSAYTVWISAYTFALATVSCHYDRFLYPGGISEFYQGKIYRINEFFHSELCLMLIVSLILMAAPVFYAQISWPRLEGYMSKTRKQTIRLHCLRKHLELGMLPMAMFVFLKLANLTPDNWGWDRVLAMAAGQLAGFVLILPVFFISTRYTVTRRIDIRRSKQQSPQHLTRRHITHPLPESVVSVVEEPDKEATMYPSQETNGHVPTAKAE